MTRNWQKLVKQLQQKKFRKQEGLFVVEGTKSVIELLQSDIQIEAIFGTSNFAKELEVNPALSQKGQDLQETDANTLGKVGSFNTNDGALAVAKIQPNEPISPENGYLLALDDVRDPGNLGTLIRIADWYNFKGIICSETCADWYNPKTIASSMGSFTRIRGYYCPLPEYLNTHSEQTPIYGAFMNGQNVHSISFPESGILVLGNESNGISEETSKQIKFPITIPRFGQAESLNVAMAGAIIADNVRRGNQ